MKRLLDLDNAERALREATMRYETIKLHVLNLERELFTLNVVEFNIEQNINVLRSTATIASVSEYKKIKEELKRVRDKMVFVRIDRSNHTKSMANAEKVLNECRDAYALALMTPVGKVIQGKFGRKDGQD